MKKQSTEVKDLTIYKKWHCRLPLDVAHVSYNYLSTPKFKSEVHLFDVIEREKSPYFFKANAETKKFVKSFYSKPLVEKEDVIKHQLTIDLETKSLGIPETLYGQLDLASFISKITYSVVTVQIQRNNARLFQLANELSNRFVAPVGINGYFTPGKSQTLPLHFDNHEVFILQIYGTKKWQILDADSKNIGKQKVLIEKILNPGDMLFIPTGYYHQAVSEDETSFHMTFGLHVFADSIVKDWLKRRFEINLNQKFSRKHMNSLNHLYFFYRYPKNFTETPFLVFENKKEGKLVIFIENHEIHLSKEYKKELKALLAKKEVKSSVMLKLKKFLLKEKII